MTDQAHHVYLDQLKHNTDILQLCRTTHSALLGCAAGISGLSGLHGFYLYAGSSTLISAVLWAIKTGGKPSRYLLGSGSDVWTFGVVDGLLSYVLFWTMAYNLVHVYE
jgi:hypothetical protein